MKVKTRHQRQQIQKEKEEEQLKKQEEKEKKEEKEKEDSNGVIILADYLEQKEFKNHAQGKKKYQEILQTGKDSNGKVYEKIIPFEQLDKDTKLLYNKEIQRLKDHQPTEVTLDWNPVEKGEVIEIKKERDFIPVTMMKHFKRPYFSPTMHAYECDVVFFDNAKYLFVININTRYLYALPISQKDKYELTASIKKLIEYGVQINSLRSDGEKGITVENAQKFFDKYDIKFFFSTSPYTQKSRIVDRCIRTIREFLDYSPKPKGVSFNKHLQDIVWLYNNTYNKSIGMKPCNMIFSEEKKYIERCKQKLMLAEKIQHVYGFHDYQKGDKLHIYLYLGKTKDSMKKRRKYYTKEGTFVEYVNGNVKCKVDGNEVVVPIYYTLSDEVKEKLEKEGFKEVFKLREKDKDNRDQVEKFHDTMEKKKIHNMKRRQKYHKKKHPELYKDQNGKL